jgi:hypothetical protein
MVRNGSNGKSPSSSADTCAQSLSSTNCDRSFRRIEEITLQSKPSFHAISTAIKELNISSEGDECSKQSNVERPDKQRSEDTLQDFHRVRLERRIRLLCPLSVLLDCHVAPPTVDELIRHALSHFGPLVPEMPLPVRCFHCPIRFGRQSHHDTGPARAWGDMLKHIATEHYQNGKRRMPNIFIPDPPLVRWMYERKLVTEYQMRAIGLGHEVLDDSNALHIPRGLEPSLPAPPYTLHAFNIKLPDQLLNQTIHD